MGLCSHNFTVSPVTDPVLAGFKVISGVVELTIFKTSSISACGVDSTELATGAGRHVEDGIAAAEKQS